MYIIEEKCSFLKLSIIVSLIRVNSRRRRKEQGLTSRKLCGKRTIPEKED